jgi:hypothetical protein
MTTNRIVVTASICALCALAGPGMAHATEIAGFNDGGTLTGTLTFNSSNDEFTQANLTTTAGTSLAGGSYDISQLYNVGGTSIINNVGVSDAPFNFVSFANGTDTLDLIFYNAAAEGMAPDLYLLIGSDGAGCLSDPDNFPSCAGAEFTGSPGSSAPFRWLADPASEVSIAGGLGILLAGTPDAAGGTLYDFALTSGSGGGGGGSTVPEPGTLALFGLGLAGVALARRRKAS